MYLGNYLRGRLADGFTFITVIFSACLIYLLRIIIWHFDILFEWIRAANVVSSRDRIYIRIYIYVLYTCIYICTYIYTYIHSACARAKIYLPISNTTPAESTRFFKFNLRKKRYGTIILSLFESINYNFEIRVNTNCEKFLERENPY